MTGRLENGAGRAGLEPWLESAALSGNPPPRVPRSEMVCRALELRGRGLLIREIADELGVALQTASGYISDPDLSKQRARRAGYAGRCVDCGRPTDGSTPKKPRPRCQECSHRRQHEQRPWTAERIIEAFREFAERVGRPPAVPDFNLARARAGCSAARIAEAEAAHATGHYPTVTTVQREFGSWRAALAAAGFAPNQVGYPSWRGRRG